ncbi:hypothetical protein FOL47_004317 [Perkinsus chesapeaki]|uniref:CRAL-TRIO domain-containing protein n=1 Tax=Perkinsus chesapeaki TaxID=330153 RepID=A0A7J6M3C7_PERCH|nr:hypothetical protein FOL47_004317 [Perkinsus chesapeaki]
MYFPNEGLTPAEYRADALPPTATHAEFQRNLDINRLANSIRTYSFIWLIVGMLGVFDSVVSLVTDGKSQQMYYVSPSSMFMMRSILICCASFTLLVWEMQQSKAATVTACVLYLLYAPLVLLELWADLACTGKSVDSSSALYSCKPFIEYDGYTLVYKVHTVVLCGFAMYMGWLLCNYLKKTKNMRQQMKESSTLRAARAKWRAQSGAMIAASKHHSSPVVTPGRRRLDSVQSFYTVSTGSDLNEPLLERMENGEVMPSIEVPMLCKSDGDLTPDELTCVRELRERLKNLDYTRRYVTHDWLKLAWARNLDVNKAEALAWRHEDILKKLPIREIAETEVQRNFSAGFSVKAGRDLDGRPMGWVRMRFMTPATIPILCGVKSTWMALDAALADPASVRLGVCLVYDFAGIGVRNITLNVGDIKKGALACGLGHISHISRVLFVDAPFIFRAAWAAVSPLLPSQLTQVVTFVNTTHDGDVEWCSGVCEPSELPAYLGGDVDGDYYPWLTTRLVGSHLAYRDYWPTPNGPEEDPSESTNVVDGLSPTSTTSSHHHVDETSLPGGAAYGRRM